jgi:putative RNA 2'-phosphotransferase
MLDIISIRYEDEHAIISLTRPGLLIGKFGSNINALTKYLQENVRYITPMPIKGIHIEEFKRPNYLYCFRAVYDMKQRFEITKEHLFHVVETNDKKRFALNDNKTRIRANQGHSVKVDLQLEPTSPPDILYHGTATRFLKPIMEEGLKSMNRTQVHLSDMIDTATNVGKRHGKLVILSVNAKQMHVDGFKFFISANGVWLTDFVPVKYLEVLSYE